MNSRVAWALAGWAAVGLLSVLALLKPIATLPSDALGLRRFRTPAIAADLRVGQTFFMPAGGLRAIEFNPARLAGPVQGSIRVELRDITDADVRAAPVIRAVELAASGLVAVARYRFEFTPIEESNGREYLLQLRSSESHPARGVAMWATRGDGYSGGALYLNDSPRWGDLAFAADAAVPSPWDLLMARPRAGGLSTSDLVLAALITYWILLAVVLRFVAGMSEPDPNPVLEM